MNIKILIVICITFICVFLLLSGCVTTEQVPWDMTGWTQTEDKIVESGEYSYQFTGYVKDSRERGHFVKINGDFDLWYEQEEGWDE